MMREQFHMILPSNSSMRYFPENTTTSFTTELPQQVELHGRWEMALTEIQFPYSFLHIRPGEGWVSFIEVMHQSTKNALNIGNFNLTPGVYSTLPELLQALNEKSKKVRAEIVWHLDTLHGGKIGLRLSCSEGMCNRTHYVKFSDKLRRILGFDVHKEREDLVIPPCENANIISHFINSDPFPNPHEDDLELFYKVTESGVLSDEPASMVRGVPDKLFVYCDICEPYVTGDVLTPLLRVVPVEYAGGKYTYGTCGVKNFSPLNYIPLRLTRFRTIEIDIRDQTGERIPFEFGTLTVTLQFRRYD